MTVLRFVTTTPPIPVTVDTFVIRSVKSDDSSAFCDNFCLRQVRRKSDTSPTKVRRSANACGRLRTLADACERLRTLASTNATTSRRLLDPWTPTLKREPFCYAFGKKKDLLYSEKNRVFPHFNEIIRCFSAFIFALAKHVCLSIEIFQQTCFAMSYWISRKKGSKLTILSVVFLNIFP